MSVIWLAVAAMLLGCSADNSEAPVTSIVDPNAQVLIDASMLGIPHTLDMLLEVTLYDSQLCRITPEWKMYRGETHEDKNCEEYAKVLTQFMEEVGFASPHSYFGKLALCWLMDPCSKGQP